MQNHILFVIQLRFKCYFHFKKTKWIAYMLSLWPLNIFVMIKKSLKYLYFEIFFIVKIISLKTKLQCIKASKAKQDARKLILFIKSFRYGVFKTFSIVLLFMPYNQIEHATWNQQKKMCKVILINRWNLNCNHCTCQKHFSIRRKQNLFRIPSVLQQVDLDLIS